jgi:hypothetical protein
MNWIKMYDKAGSVLRVEMVISGKRSDAEKTPRHSRFVNTCGAAAAK